ncbi:ArnT family glycosyltransferase [Dinghuibacter silviterrae]|uniref:Dolichyl-phosphate-mannose-protein mannosyltransferase n=1 Tax=Dinghuibacter silviterrae TaxID=1539049 RepID=A0A4V3GLQ4_9BACT|nr:hypothetical protein [Dinghuibacter silviterrae]TDX00433.1 hypothetical protein EDB95_1457 [Dinghuibacter silviterrae]
MSRRIPWTTWLVAAILGFLVFIHLALLAPGVDAGLHLYGSFLLTKGLLPYTHLWNNKPFLIYVIGLAGFIVRGNPFLGARFLELAVLGLDCWLLAGIVRAFGRPRPAWYISVFLVLYLLSWDQGFLTETFVLPLTLWYARAFARKSARTVWIGGAALVLACLLKQNGAVIIAGIAFLDIITADAPDRKALGYVGIFLAGMALTALLLWSLGIGREFLDQVFIYNSESAARPGPGRWLRVQLMQNSFLAYHGVSLLLVLNAWMAWIALRALARWVAGRGRAQGGPDESGARQWPDRMQTACAAIYLAAYPLVYLSGKTYAHYFLFLLLPTTLILGDLVIKYRLARMAMLAALAWAVNANIGAIPQNRAVSKDMNGIAERIKSTTSDTTPIVLAGFGNQYLYILSDRLCSTRFLVPLQENAGYSKEYRNTLDTEMQGHPPACIVLIKNNYRGLDPGNYYTKLITERLNDYRLDTENGSFALFCSKVPLESTSKVP